VSLDIQKSTIWKFKMAAAAILENTQRAYLGQLFINLHQIWFADQYGRCRGIQGVQISWTIHKRVYLNQFLAALHYLWYADKYGRYKGQKQPIIALLEIHDGGGRHLRKYTKGVCISANSGPICTKFCTLIEMDDTNVYSSKSSNHLTGPRTNCNRRFFGFNLFIRSL